MAQGCLFDRSRYAHVHTNIQKFGVTSKNPYFLEKSTVWLTPNFGNLHVAGLYLWKPRAMALSVASCPLRPIWQWNTSSGASREGFATPYLAWNSAASSAKAVSTVSTTETRRKRRMDREGGKGNNEVI